jgi:hypothetical protein
LGLRLHIRTSKQRPEHFVLILLETTPQTNEQQQKGQPSREQENEFAYRCNNVVQNPE